MCIIVDGLGLKGRSKESVGFTIGHLLQTPMQSIGIEDQTKKGSLANHGKDVIKGAAGTKSVVETNFGDIVFPAIPTNGGGFYLLGFGIIGEGNSDRDIDFLSHETTLHPKNTRSQWGGGRGFGTML